MSVEQSKLDDDHRGSKNRPASEPLEEKDGERTDQPQQDINDKTLTLSFGGWSKEKVWRKWQGTIGEMSQKWFATHREGPKDGPCILQGELVGSERSTRNIMANYVVMFDHDVGQTIDELEDSIASSGYAAILWTTISHNKPESEIHEDAFVNFKNKNGLETEDVKTVAALYLSQVKGISDKIITTIQEVRIEHRDGGVKYIVSHAPMHRVRSLFILDEPYFFSIEGFTQKARVEEWKSRYGGFALKHGLKVDTKCVDPSRLMYLPRYAPGTNPSIHQIRFLDGAPLRWQNMPMLATEESKKTQAAANTKSGLAKRPSSSKTAPQNTHTGLPSMRTPGLAQFVVDHTLDFQVADWLCEACAEPIRRQSEEKVTFACPLDELHTDAGNPADTGFFCVNGDPDEGRHWKMWCQHTTCSMQTEQDRAAYLDAACIKYGIKDARELLPYCLRSDGDERDVFERDSFAAAIDKSTSLFEEGNSADPRIFWNPFQARYCRIEPNRREAILEALTNDGQWQFELKRHVNFKRRIREGREASVPASTALIGALRGNSALRVPVCNSIICVPSFSPDGTLRTERGYDPASETYLVPWGQFLTVSEVVLDADVNHGLGILALALRDFPFSDVFSGPDPEPPRVDGELDSAGFPEPNYRRGTSSRAHALALLLTPIVRPMIAGPTPIYFIDKPKPGTGAGFLLNLLSAVVWGRRAGVSTLGKTAEEIGKQVTAKLRSGNPLLVFDNIDQHVDSDALAAAITGGSWHGRILGTSNDTDIKIRATWAFSSNHGSMSSDLMRRAVPIRMDAATDDPAVDRKPEYFKIHSLGQTYNEWLDANKLHLVWALHVLVKYWLQCCRGGYKYNGRVLPTFDEYSNVIGGILDRCGVDGFLENTDVYLATRNEERDANKMALEALNGSFKQEAFTASDALAVLRDPLDSSETRLKFDILPPERADRIRSQGGLGAALGHWLKGMVNQGVHRLPNGTSVSISRKKCSGVSRYTIKPSS